MLSLENQALRQSLLAVYEDCPPVEQAILQLMSVIYEGVSKTALTGYIRDSGIETCKTKGFLPTSLTQAINRLTKKNLIVKGGDQQLRCHFPAA